MAVKQSYNTPVIAAYLFSFVIAAICVLLAGVLLYDYWWSRLGVTVAALVAALGIWCVLICHLLVDLAAKIEKR